MSVEGGRLIQHTHQQPDRSVQLLVGQRNFVTMGKAAVRGQCSKSSSSNHAGVHAELLAERCQWLVCHVVNVQSHTECI